MTPWNLCTSGCTVVGKLIIKDLPLFLEMRSLYYLTQLFKDPESNSTGKDAKFL